MQLMNYIIQSYQYINVSYQWTYLKYITHIHNKQSYSKDGVPLVYST